MTVKRDAKEGGGKGGEDTDSQQQVASIVEDDIDGDILGGITDLFQVALARQINTHGTELLVGEPGV